MPTPREVALVNKKVGEMFEAMEPRHIALLISKIMYPDKTLIAISNELWPELGYARRNQIIAQSKVNSVLGMVKSRPWIMAAIMGNKLAPIMVSVLYELALNPETKSNVRATAAKELIRLAQSTASSLASSDDEPLPTEEMEGLLAGSEESELDDALADEEPEVEVRTADELLSS